MILSPTVGGKFTLFPLAFVVARMNNTHRENQKNRPYYADFAQMNDLKDQILSSIGSQVTGRLKSEFGLTGMLGGKDK